MTMFASIRDIKDKEIWQLKSNFYPVTAYLPKERDSVVSELQHIIDTVSEEEMVEYRRKLKSLG